MSAAERYFHQPEPKRLDQLSRTAIAARIETLREAIDSLYRQSKVDGGAAFECLGSMKKALYWLEDRLRDLDRQASTRIGSSQPEVR